MKAIWLENQKLTLRDDIPIPDPQPGEALIRVRAAGICSTDLELLNGYYPYTGILGHEFVGEVVEAIGEPTLVGKRVVGEINLACGECETCQARMPTHCTQRKVLGIKNQPGAFAEYLTLPFKNLYPIPDSIPDELAVFTEPLAAALEVQEQVQIRPNDRVLVVGAGRLGQLIAQTLALIDCDLSVVVRHENQRHILTSRNIAAVSDIDVPEQYMDVVIDATGSPEGFVLARKAVRPRGTLVIKSTYAGDLQVNFSSIVVDEITIVGSRCGPFSVALRLLETGQVDPSHLTLASYPLSDGLRAFEHASRPGALKVLLLN